MFEVAARDSETQARVGRLTLPHGVVQTPAFMPVGTQGTVKCLSVQDLKSCGVEILLGNVYHLSLRPGKRILEAAGGLHRFMAWDGPLLTDSGGYQVFSLAARAEVAEEGVTFASPVDGSTHSLTPEGVVEFQRAIGSDVVIPLDHCVRYPCGRPEAEGAVERTTQWAKRSKRSFERGEGSRVKGEGKNDFPPPSTVHPSPLLFGIVQGAAYPDLRRQAAQRLLEIGFDGYAIGGFSVGEPKALLFDLLPGVTGELPEDRPRYLMGMGEPPDLIEAVRAGVDLFDCVIPTRHGRNGVAYTSGGKLNLRNARHAADPRPVDPACACEVCRTHSRLYLRHLFQTQEILGLRLLSFHNVWYYTTLMSAVRRAIAAGELEEFGSQVAAAYPSRIEEVVE